MNETQRACIRLGAIRNRIENPKGFSQTSLYQAINYTRLKFDSHNF